MEQHSVGLRCSSLSSNRPDEQRSSTSENRRGCSKVKPFDTTHEDGEKGSCGTVDVSSQGSRIDQLVNECKLEDKVSKVTGK